MKGGLVERRAYDQRRAVGLAVKGAAIEPLGQAVADVPLRPDLVTARVTETRVVIVHRTPSVAPVRVDGPRQEGASRAMW
jgi:hypothetical protein